MWIELYNVYKAFSPARCSSLLQLEQWHSLQWSLPSVQCRTRVKQQLHQSEIYYESWEFCVVLGFGPPRSHHIKSTAKSGLGTWLELLPGRAHLGS